MGRKQSMVPTMSGSGSGRRLVGVLVVLVLLGLVLRDPIGTAHKVHQLAAWASTALDALASFGSAVSK